MERVTKLLALCNLHNLWTSLLQHALLERLGEGVLDELDGLASWVKARPRKGTVGEHQEAFAIVVAIAYARLCYDKAATALNARALEVSEIISAGRKSVEDMLGLAASLDDRAGELETRAALRKDDPVAKAMREEATKLRATAEALAPVVEQRAAEAVKALRAEPGLTFRRVLEHWSGAPEDLREASLDMIAPPIVDHNWSNLFDELVRADED